MASSTPTCGVRKHDNINKLAVVWCSECDEGLCDDCKQHHSKSKSSRNHSTLPITEYQNLPSHVLEIREYCEEHNEKFHLFCKNHDCPCCRICGVDRHHECKGVTAIERVIQNVKASDSFQETEHLISEILETIVELRKDKINNLSSVQQQRKDVEKEFLEARAKINKHLNNIQAKIMQELIEIEKKITQQTNEVLTSLNEDENQLMDYQATMSSIKQYATDLQALLSIKRVEADAANKESSMQKLITTGVMNNTIVSCEVGKVVQNLKENIPALGKVIVQSLPCKITISRKKNKQAQIMVVPTHSCVIEDKTLKLQQTMNTARKETKGCVLLHDRKAFSCYDRDSVRSINTDRSKHLDTRTGTWTFDITYIDDTNTIAVTSGGSYSQYINIIDLRNGKVKATIQANSWCYGIVYRNKTLIYTAHNKGLRMIDLCDNSVSDIITSKMSQCGCMSSEINLLTLLFLPTGNTDDSCSPRMMD